MGQVKIWLNSQPDISEIPKFLLLIMIIITVFFMITTLVIKGSYFFGVLAHFLHIFFIYIVNVVVKKGVTATLWHSAACDVWRVIL